jgi:hypothetical protein
LGQSQALFFGLSLTFDLLADERFDPGEFFLKAIRKIGSSVFEKHDKAKSEKDKKCNPKQAAQQRHGGNRS